MFVNGSNHALKNNLSIILKVDKRQWPRPADKHDTDSRVLIFLNEQFHENFPIIGIVLVVLLISFVLVVYAIAAVRMIAAKRKLSRTFREQKCRRRLTESSSMTATSTTW